MTKFLFAGAAAGLVLLSACGSEQAANNSGGDLNAAAGVPLGNDASAMEIVGNQAAGAIPMPASGAGNTTAPASGGTAPRERNRADESNRSRSASPPAEDVDDSPSGGDRGGNAAQGNLSGV